MGKDRLSLLYIVQMAEHMRELRSSQHSLIASYDLPAERVSQALDRMELGMFSATT